MPEKTLASSLALSAAICAASRRPAESFLEGRPSRTHEHAGAYLWRLAVRSGLMHWPAVVGSKRDMPVPMRRRHRIALLLCAASLLTASARPRPLVAGETDEISSTLSSQAVHADSIQPAPPAQPSAAPYQMDQEITEPEPQGAQEYMDANEQVSVFGIEMRLDARKAERDIQGALAMC